MGTSKLPGHNLTKCWEVKLWWTSIPSMGSRNTPSCFILQKLELCTSTDESSWPGLIMIKADFFYPLLSTLCRGERLFFDLPGFAVKCSFQNHSFPPPHVSVGQTFMQPNMEKSWCTIETLAMQIICCHRDLLSNFHIESGDSIKLIWHSFCWIFR